MSTTAHTPEPWFLHRAPVEGWGDDKFVISGGGGDDASDVDIVILADRERNREMPNWARLVSCVNACAGMADPAKEIAFLREFARRTQELAQQLSTVVVQREAKQEELDSILSVIPIDAPCLHAETGETVADYILGLQREVERVHALHFNDNQRLKTMGDAIKKAHTFAFDILRNYECGMEIDIKCEETIAHLTPHLPSK